MKGLVLVLGFPKCRGSPALTAISFTEGLGKGGTVQIREHLGSFGINLLCLCNNFLARF